MQIRARALSLPTKHSPVATALGIIAPDHAHVYFEQHWYENLPVFVRLLRAKAGFRSALLGDCAFGLVGVISRIVSGKAIGERWWRGYVWFGGLAHRVDGGVFAMLRLEPIREVFAPNFDT